MFQQQLILQKTKSFTNGKKPIVVKLATLVIKEVSNANLPDSALELKFTMEFAKPNSTGELLVNIAP